jgi:hypothetical protein
MNSLKEAAALGGKLREARLSTLLNMGWTVRVAWHARFPRHVTAGVVGNVIATRLRGFAAGAGPLGSEQEDAHQREDHRGGDDAEDGGIAEPVEHALAVGGKGVLGDRVLDGAARVGHGVLVVMGLVGF